MNKVEFEVILDFPLTNITDVRRYKNLQNIQVY